MHRDLDLEATIVRKYAAVSSELNERGRRLWAAAESIEIGYGGVALVSSATGLSRTTIRMGCQEIERGVTSSERIRREGAGPETRCAIINATNWNSSVVMSRIPPSREVAFENEVTAIFDLGDGVNATQVH